MARLSPYNNFKHALSDVEKKNSSLKSLGEKQIHQLKARKQKRQSWKDQDEKQKIHRKIQNSQGVK